MAATANPLVGSGWQNPIPQTQPFNMDINTNPGSFGNPKGEHGLRGNIVLENTLAGGIKNHLAPQWAQLMGQYGKGAGDFFQQLMNFGSPFYRQKQQEAFTQGVQQNQNAAAEAKQRLRQTGYGAAPSGNEAAMIGGMESAGAKSLSEQYLQNLFNNEQLQMGGAQGLAGLAQLFNPSSLLGGTEAGTQIPQSGSFFDNFASIMNPIANLTKALRGGGSKGEGG